MENKKADVVVVAAGLSGLAASIAAAEEGKSVITVEKSNVTGGAANMGMSPLAIGTHYQRSANFNMTPGEAWRKHMNFIHWQGDARLIKKYYEKDYFIINTPMPLSAVFLSDSKNFLYSGFDNDLKNINSAYPTEYLTEYGGNASIRNNIENKRISRQCGIGFNSNKYIFSAYNILLHNPIIFFKKQLNNYLISNGFYQKFYFKSPKFTSITDGISEDALEFYNKVNEYYYIGKNDININYPLFTKYTIGKKINHFLTFIYKIWHYLGKHFMKYNKVLVTISMVLCVLICLLKKEFVLFFIGSNILAIFLAVFLFAPDPHYEYYYSTYICQYLFLSYFIKTILKKGMKTI